MECRIVKKISKKQYEYYWDFIITNDANKYNEFIDNQNDFDSILNQYKKTDISYKVDLSSRVVRLVLTQY